MKDQLPGPVRWARILMFVIAGLTFALAVVAFIRLGMSAHAFGYVLGASLPGVAQLILGLMVRRRGRILHAAIVTVQVLFIAYTLLTLGSEGVVTQLVLPTTVLVLVLLRSSREYFRQPAQR
ncbi:hypothetical protein [Nocardiopsis ansamitocini]|uniref:Uncharacterized protein n=1 Tax=Nocardiopsis ansamitocini TaxID=1670832 RepID=A0A9W6P4Y7_9ACTN|nr:hypothetical protein [Nocardiopsis ansamitocini]GLU47152.1 hypothetical protein Nans01_15030 [Nocardiopsis ansamitocini]